MSEIAICTKVC